MNTKITFQEFRPTGQYNYENRCKYNFLKYWVQVFNCIPLKCDFVWLVTQSSIIIIKEM